MSLLTKVKDIFKEAVDPDSLRPRVLLQELHDVHPCPTCGRASIGGPGLFIGSDPEIGNIATRMYVCPEQHIWYGRVKAECKIDPEYQKQIWNALRPDLCCFCKQPFTDDRKTFGKGEFPICHIECRDQERKARGIF